MQFEAAVFLNVSALCKPLNSSLSPSACHPVSPVNLCRPKLFSTPPAEWKSFHFLFGALWAWSLNFTSTKAMHRLVNTCSTMSARALLRLSSCSGRGQRQAALWPPRLSDRGAAGRIGKNPQPRAEHQRSLHSAPQPRAKIQVANNVLLSIFNIAESIYSGTQLLCKAEIECSAHHSMFCHMVYRMAYQIIPYVDPIFKAGIVSNFLTVVSGLKILHERKQRLYNVIEIL